MTDGMRGVLKDGLRTLVFRRPGLDAPPVPVWGVPLLFALLILLVLGGGWLMSPGPVEFHRWAVGTGWLGTLWMAIACLVAVRTRPDRDGATVFGWLLVQWIVICAFSVAGFALLIHGYLREGVRPDWFAWGVAGVAQVWIVAAAGVLLVPMASGRGARAMVLVLVLAAGASYMLFPTGNAWRPVMDDAAGAEAWPEPMVPDQAALEAQSRSLIDALDGVAAQRPGVTELFAITFAPYASEDVFSREVKMVGGMLDDRFDTAGRRMNLQNHASTLATVPWATPLNLQRAIDRMAARMDRDEDILFLHLTSHGARDGRLAAGFEPLAVAEVTPAELRRWLDDAGVRYAVISISACFSGSWIPALEAPGTLVLTAADATHTSYGCGRKSELTFFGRAMYDEQLRKTRSFEAAFAAALPVIDRREKEAGKSDGPSNPQMRMGVEVRPRLEALVKRLEAP